VAAGRATGLAQQVGVVIDHRVRPMRAQTVGLPDPVDPDHPSEAARTSGFDPSEAVLENRRGGRLHAQGTGCGQERVRCRLAA